MSTVNLQTMAQAEKDALLTRMLAEQQGKLSAPPAAPPPAPAPAAAFSPPAAPPFAASPWGAPAAPPSLPPILGLLVPVEIDTPQGKPTFYLHFGPEYKDNPRALIEGLMASGVPVKCWKPQQGKGGRPGY